MAKKKVRHLPITENDKIVGMISVKDLVAFYANPRLR
jgi:signal-transduction protein with cAMP-binding, CBS, and nucleotidyltransferase domain